MQKQNVTEYKIIRSEMESIKNCITSYVGFLILGVGATFSAWGGIGALSAGTDTLKLKTSIGYSSLAISIIAIFMLFILIYKFISHNRYAGYCLLLSQEIWENDTHINDLLIWECCVDILRTADIKTSALVPKEYEKFIPALNFKRKTLSLSNVISIFKSFFSNIWFLFKSLFVLNRTGSWKFPLTVLRIFFVVILACIGFGAYILCPILKQGYSNKNPEYIVAFLFIIGVVGTQLILWCNIAKQFRSVMDGENTVLRFYKKFRPIREIILKENFGIIARWVLDLPQSGQIPDTQ